MSKYVYVYYHPVTGNAIYVGIGHGTRYLWHLKQAKMHLNDDTYNPPGNKLKYYTIRKILMLNKEPIIHIVCKDKTHEDACKIECDLIKVYGRISNNTGSLTNLTDGGEGLLNPTKETRQKLGDANRGRVKSDNERSLIKAGVQKDLASGNRCGENHWMNNEAFKDIRKRVIDAGPKFSKGNIPHNAGKAYDEVYGGRSSDIKRKIGDKTIERNYNGSNNPSSKCRYVLNVENDEKIDISGVFLAFCQKNHLNRAKLRKTKTTLIPYKEFILYEQ